MSYAQLVAILREVREVAAEERRKPLVECPHDGERLDVRDGVYSCPFCGYRTTRAIREQ